jgi:hypothetical protein
MKRISIVLLQRGPTENYGFEEDLSTPHIEFMHKNMDVEDTAYSNSYGEIPNKTYIAMDYSKLGIGEDDIQKIKKSIKNKNIVVHVYKNKKIDPSKYNFVIFLREE